MNVNLSLEIIKPNQTGEITDKKEIARGGFGVVYKAKWRGQKVAIKELQANDFTPSALADFQKECEMMAKLRCDHLVNLYAITQQPCGLIMEYMRGKSLRERLDKGPVTWAQRYRWAKEIGQGLVFLHTTGVFHRDIKCDNVFLTKSDQAKLGDLGLSKLASTSNTTLVGMVGTYPWMAPELLQNVKYSDKSDMYSYGVLLWELATQKMPFAESENKFLIPMQVLMGGLKLDIPAEIPPAYSALIRACCEIIPEKRPTAQEAVSKISAILKTGPRKVPPSQNFSGTQTATVEKKSSSSGYVLRSNPPQSSQNGYLGSVFQNLQTLNLTEAEKIKQERRAQIEAFAFGKDKWMESYGDPGPVPPLPDNIDQILSAPCPFLKDQTVEQTHLLVLIPKTINGKLLTLKSLSTLIEHPKQGHPTKYCYVESESIMKDYGEQPCERSHWILILREAIPSTPMGLRKSPIKLTLEEFGRIMQNGVYQIPTILEVTVCFATNYVCSGKWLYSKQMNTSDSGVGVGGGSKYRGNGLDFHLFDPEFDWRHVAPTRIL